MAKFKLSVSTPDGKVQNLEVEGDRAQPLLGKSVGEIVDGQALGLQGMKLEITGGSDKDGFPMRSDLKGGRKARLLLSGGVGFRVKRKGERRKKSVRGNLITDQTVQLNMVVVEAGEKKLEELFPPKPKEEKKK